MYVHVCMYMCVCTCATVCMRVRMCKNELCLDENKYIFIVHVSLCIYMWTCGFIIEWICAYKGVYIYMCVCVPACVTACVCTCLALSLYLSLSLSLLIAFSKSSAADNSA